MSNCVVRPCGPGLPCSIVADHGIERSDHLAHDDDTDFGFLIGRDETIVEDFKDGIVPSCAEGSHLEDRTDRHAAAVDPAMSFELASVEVVRRKSERAATCLPHLPELWRLLRRRNIASSTGLVSDRDTLFAKLPPHGDHFG